MKTSVTREEIVKVLYDQEPDKDCLVLSGGVFTIRRGWYWTPKRSVEEQFAGTVARLTEAGYVLSNVDYGDVDKGTDILDAADSGVIISV